MNKALKKIDSFQVSHTALESGLYISRVDNVNGVGVITYDIRVIRPNCGYMSSDAVHTCEHIIASYLRTYSNNIIYFGVMACLTGFYLIVYDLTPQEVKKLLLDAFNYLSKYEGEIIGATIEECGNYKFHDLIGAKQIAETYLETLNKIKSYNYV